MSDNEKNYNSEFSIKLDGMELEYPALDAIGEKKLTQMRDNFAKRTRNCAYFAGYMGLLVTLNIAGWMYNPKEGTHPQENILLGAVGVAAVAAIARGKYALDSAKNLDQAVVAVNGDTQVAKYKSTADALVQKGVFKKEQIGDAVSFERMTPQ